MFFPNPLRLDAQAAIDGVSKLTLDMEAKWGVGRLELLVSDELRLRFRRQREKLISAVDQGKSEEIIRHAQAMGKGWDALDKAATDAGAAPLSPDVWEIALSDGRVIALVRSFPEAIWVSRSARYVDVWTAQEIANVIEAFPKIAKPHASHRGNLVPQQSLPKKPIDSDPDDQIPF